MTVRQRWNTKGPFLFAGLYQKKREGNMLLFVDHFSVEYFSNNQFFIEAGAGSPKLL